jgi:hypothetical protein
VTKFIFVSLWLVISPFAFAQTPPRRSQREPTVELATPDYVYRSTIDSLTRLDFRNLSLHIFNARGESTLAAQLRNGRYDSKEHDRKGRFGHGYDWLRLDWVRFLGENSDFAVISFSWVTAGASASDFGVVQVFTLRQGHPVVVQQLLFNTRGCGASAHFSTRLSHLTIKGVHGWDHCCPRTLDVIKFRWADGSFHQESHYSAPLPESC